MERVIWRNPKDLGKNLSLKLVHSARLRTELSDRAVLTNGKDYFKQTNVTYV